MKLVLPMLLLFSTVAVGAPLGADMEPSASTPPAAPLTVTLTQAELQLLLQAEATKAVTAFMAQEEAAKAKDVYAKINAALSPPKNK